MALDRNASLDGVRGFAALYVLTFHQLSSGQFQVSILDKLIQYGHSAVSLFFLVSGFLLYSRLENRINFESNWRTSFYIRRFFRIIPLWWALLVAVYYIDGLPFNVLAANLFFYFGFLQHNPVYLPIIPSWSLFVEEIFYLMLPWIFPLLKKSQNLVLFLIGSYLLSMLWLNQAESWGAPGSNHFIQRNPLSHFQMFFLGIGFYRFYKSSIFREWFGGGLVSGYFTWLDLFALLAYFAPAFQIFVPVELGCLIFFAAAMNPQTAIHRISKNSLLRWIGIHCYSIYLCQLTLSGWVSPLRPIVFGGLNLSSQFEDLLWFPIFMLTVLAFAKIIWVVLEAPCIRLGHRLAHRFGN